MTDITPEQIAEIEGLLAKAVAGPWQYRDDYTTEGFVTIIGNVDGEYIDGIPECTYDVVCRCEDEFGERLPNVATNVRLIVALVNAAPSLILAAKERDRLKAENERLREANGILEDALQEAGDDYPGSNMQDWCQQQIKAARQALKGTTHD